MTIDQKNQALVIEHVGKEIVAEKESIEYQFEKMLTAFEAKFPFIKVDSLVLSRTKTIATEGHTLACDINLSLSIGGGE
jgi:hypothetical protein